MESFLFPATLTITAGAEGVEPPSGVGELGNKRKESEKKLLNYFKFRLIKK